MDIPSREGPDTGWGVLYASSTHEDKVLLSSTNPNGGHPRRCLILNRVEYACHLELSREQLSPVWRDTRHYIDGTWHVSSGELWHEGLCRQHDGARATVKARLTLRDRVLPIVADWLRSPDAVSLREEGGAFRMADRLEQAATAESLLVAGIDRVRAIRAKVTDGATVDAEDEQFLRYVRDTFASFEPRDHTGLRALHRAVPGGIWQSVPVSGSAIEQATSPAAGRFDQPAPTDPGLGL